MLLLAPDDRQHQTATLGELFKKRRRDTRGRGGDDNRVIRAVFFPAKVPVTEQNRHIVVAELGEQLTRGGHQLGHNLNGIHLFCQ